ncbi:hypothetical protein EST38_g7368 [Candolleomyces aberdarensis]|uniref:Uncharacterized protein n=1 Tax=Candolleomyces aberdarensis TaxID=2316362 RepID=A0A4Q2DI62_9AGAR|nr:hypothetical protein EST38_g7368 [Candolleomyces aberdarensis]
MTETFNEDAISYDISVQSFESLKLQSSREVTCLQISPDCRYIAIGDGQGRITIRSLERNGLKIAVFNGGRAEMRQIVWHPSPTEAETFFVCSGNGFVNCVNFQNVEDSITSPKITAVRVSAFPTAIAVNDSGTQLSVCHDDSTKFYSLPFPKGDPRQSRPDNVPSIYHGLRHVGRTLPIRDHMKPLQLHYQTNDIILVSFFSCITAFDTSNLQELWSIRPPTGTQIGSCAMSPSRKYIVATNLHSGLDWYSLTTLTWLSATKIEDDYDDQNFILPVLPLTDTTVACGHNSGYVVAGSLGVDKTVKMGKDLRRPCQVMAVGTSWISNRLFVASADENDIIIRIITTKDHGAVIKPQVRKGKEKEKEPADPLGPQPSSSLAAIGFGAESSRTSTNALNDVETRTQHTALPPNPFHAEALPQQPVKKEEAQEPTGHVSGSQAVDGEPSNQRKRDEEGERRIDTGRNLNAWPAKRRVKQLALLVVLLVAHFLLIWSSRSNSGDIIHEGGAEFGHEFEDYEECACDNPVVVTETKIITVTRAVTTTITLSTQFSPLLEGINWLKSSRSAPPQFIWPVFQLFPWAHNTILRSAGPLHDGAGAVVKTLALKLDEMNKELRTDHTTRDAARISELLNRNTVQALFREDRNRYSSHHYESFCDIIVACHVLVLFSPPLPGPPVSISTNTIPSSFKKNLSTIHKKFVGKGKRLSDWPALLETGAFHVQSINNVLTGRSSAFQSTGPLAGINNMRNLGRMSAGLGVAENYLFAGFHMSFLLNGSCTSSTASPNLQIPNMPNNPEDVIAEIQRTTGHTFDTEDTAYIRELFTPSKQDSHVDVKLPLYVAVNISPAGLKLPFRVSKCGVSKAATTLLSAFHREKKPVALQQSEDITWALLKGFFQCQEPLFSVLHEACQSFPWEAIRGSTDEERAWLHLGAVPNDKSSTETDGMQKISPSDGGASSSALPLAIPSDELQPRTRKRKEHPGDSDGDALLSAHPLAIPSDELQPRTRTRKEHPGDTDNDASSSTLPLAIPTSELEPRTRKRKEHPGNTDSANTQAVASTASPTLPKSLPTTSPSPAPGCRGNKHAQGIDNCQPTDEDETPLLADSKRRRIGSISSATQGGAQQEDNGWQTALSQELTKAMDHNSLHNTASFSQNTSQADPDHEDVSTGEDAESTRSTTPTVCETSSSSRSQSPHSTTFANLEGSGDVKVIETPSINLSPAGSIDTVARRLEAPFHFGLSGKHSKQPIDVDQLDRYRATLHPILSNDGNVAEETKFEVFPFTADGYGPCFSLQCHNSFDTGLVINVISLVESYYDNKEPFHISPTKQSESMFLCKNPEELAALRSQSPGEIQSALRRWWIVGKLISPVPEASITPQQCKNLSEEDTLAMFLNEIEGFGNTVEIHDQSISIDPHVKAAICHGRVELLLLTKQAKQKRKVLSISSVPSRKADPMMMFWHDVLVEGKFNGINRDEVLRHVPTLESFESTLDLFALVSLSMLSNVLDERTYTEEQVPKHDRALYIASRRAAMMTVKWFFDTHDLFDSKTQTAIDGYSSFWYPMLGMQATALLEFKRKADNQYKYDPRHSTSCTVDELRQQLQYVIDIYPPSNNYFDPDLVKQESLYKPLTWLTSVDDLVYEVRKRPEQSPTHPAAQDDMYQSPILGYTLDDFNLFKTAGSHSNFL